MLRKLHIVFVVMLALGATVSAAQWTTGILNRWPGVVLGNSWKPGIAFRIRWTESHASATVFHHSKWGPLTVATSSARSKIITPFISSRTLPLSNAASGWAWGGFAMMSSQRFVLTNETGLRVFGIVSPPTKEATRDTWSAYAPLWAITLLLGGYPLFLFVAAAARHRHRRKHGLCIRCGYDLRGSLDAGRCPECGTGFEKPMTDGAKP